MINNKLVGFNAVLPLPHKNLKNAYRESRLVILPDYQGVGLGSFFSDYIAERYKQQNKLFYSTTSNPALIKYRQKSKKWIIKRIGRINENKKSKISRGLSKNRLTVSSKYVGNDELTAKGLKVSVKS
jgi:GNAT superfamily N-acetyltransferase